MAKKKAAREVNQVQAMQDAVVEMGKGLGVDIKFGTDKGLEGFQMGRPLTMGEVRKAAQEKRPVWVYYREGEDDSPRINDAKWVSVERESFMFTDGSSFASEMDIMLDHLPAEDDCCGEGEMKVYEAVR